MGLFNKKKNKNSHKALISATDDISCPECKELNRPGELEKNLYTCGKCGHYFTFPLKERVDLIADPGTFIEFNSGFTSKNPLKLDGYAEKLIATQNKTSLKEAATTGSCKIDGLDAILGVMTFKFIGGSMGSVVGEKIFRAMVKGAETGKPVILVTASGGARMQEGIFSLQQMAKTSHGAALLEKAGVPLIILLTHPTTGGVTASFAMLGDVILAEPEALIGFAGPRVIQGTINQKLPKGFQRSEFLLEKGFVDMIVPRTELKRKLSFLLKTHQGRQLNAKQ